MSGGASDGHVGQLEVAYFVLVLLIVAFFGVMSLHLFLSVHNFNSEGAFFYKMCAS